MPAASLITHVAGLLFVVSCMAIYLSVYNLWKAREMSAEERERIMPRARLLLAVGIVLAAVAVALGLVA